MDSRVLARNKAVLMIHVVPRERIAELRIDATSSRADLRIDPSHCVLYRLSPPEAVSSRSPPYALPLVPLCSLVLSAARSASFPLRIRVRDANGTDLVAPIDTMVTIQGVSR